MRMMLVGNPLSGKTKLLHALKSFHYEVTELPGVYSLSVGGDSDNVIHQVVQPLLHQSPDLLINVVDATQLERQLILTTQLMEMDIPMIVVLTHMDKLHGKVNTRLLEKTWGIPVIALSSDLTPLLTILAQDPAQHIAKPLPIKELAAYKGQLGFMVRRYIEGNASYRKALPAKVDKIPNAEALALKLLDLRYQWVHDLSSQVLNIEHTFIEKLTARLDDVLLHRFLGWPIFLMVLWLFFSVAINFGGKIQQQLTGLSEYFFEHWLNDLLSQGNVWTGLNWVLVHGLGQGVSTMLSFLPVMTFMNLFLSVMESTGYMARVAFLFERIMRSIGLPGKAFLPLFIGFGCNVPAIMSARMVDGGRERLLTVLLSPFMSCSARLTIYAVFASLFFPEYGGWIVLSLYLLGVVMAIFTGWILRSFWLQGKAMPLMMELPLFQWPNAHKLFRDIVIRLKLFIIRSGKLVVPFCMLLGTVQGAIQYQNAHHYQWVQYLWGAWVHVIQPLLAPIGISVENWPAAVSLLTGTMAKEVVVATLNTLYVQIPVAGDHVHLTHAFQSHWYMFRQLAVIPETVSKIWDAHSSRALMWAFGGPVAAYSYLLFVLLYVPCISTLAIIRQEVGAFWQKFAFVWSFVLAYSVASLFYQIATCFAHPLQTLLWCLGLLGLWTGIIMLFHHWKPAHVHRD
jgi:ferrous iron transport protein B